MEEISLFLFASLAFLISLNSAAIQITRRWYFQIQSQSWYKDLHSCKPFVVLNQFIDTWQMAYNQYPRVWFLLRKFLEFGKTEVLVISTSFLLFSILRLFDS
jgi:hypothetical protein